MTRARREALRLALAVATAALMPMRAGFLFAAEKVARIGLVGPESPTTMKRALPAFWARLGELGWIEGVNLAREERWAEGHIDRLPTLMAEVVSSKIDVLVTFSTPAAVAAKNATTTVPIVVAAMSDPVGVGVAASLARPGGNLTGLSLQMTEGIPGKWLEILHEALPALQKVAVIGNPDSPFFTLVRRPLAVGASTRGLKLRFFPARNREALESTFRQARRWAQAAIVLTDPMIFQNQRTVIALAAKHHLPVLYSLPEFVDAGGLISYGADLTVLFRRAAEYVDRILRGAHPADLPIEQPTQYKLVVSLKAANGLGLTFPESILLRADEVIR
jgi:putative ABC transport system substrate-binding protein